MRVATGPLFDPHHERLAQDPTTDPELLAQLRRHYPDAVAANPGLPLDEIFALALRHPEAALRNPALRFYAVADPTAFQNPDRHGGLLNLVRCSTTPTALLDLMLAGRHPDVLTHLLIRDPPYAPAIPIAWQVLDEITPDLHRPWSMAQLDAGHFLPGALVENGNPTPEQITDVLSLIPDERVHEALLFKRSPLPPEAQQNIAAFGYESPCLHLGKLPDTHPDTLRILAQHSTRDVRLLVAEHHRAPLDVLERLAKDRSTLVRKAVRNRPATTSP